MQEIKLYRDAFDGLITPSRDLWDAVIRGELEDILRQPGYTVEQMVGEIMVIMERERGRPIGNER